MSKQIEYAFNYCERVSKKRAKNFYYAFRTLPVQKRQAIYAIYAFCRYCDDVTDGNLSIGEKKQVLVKIRASLNNLELAGDDPVFTALRETISEFEIPTVYFEELMNGFEMDLIKNRFENFEELRNYCFCVASSVGLICLEIFGYDNDSNAKTHAIDLGIGMQLTNIMRDVKEDGGRGRIYIPLEEMVRHEYTESELMVGLMNDKYHSLMDAQAKRARKYLDSGQQLSPLVKIESRPCVAILYSLYSAILNRIVDNDYQVFGNRIGLNNMEKIILTVRLWASTLIIKALNLKK
ncbi:MAG: phytoene/squalene synthase family protein [Chloroflexota bacterium]|nr:phytoene/squalene synthase family protein [Chloroflexota bacterium]